MIADPTNDHTRLLPKAPQETAIRTVLKSPAKKLLIPSLTCGPKGFIISSMSIVDTIFVLLKSAITFPIYGLFPSLIPSTKTRKSRSFDEYKEDTKARLSRNLNAIWQNKIPLVEMQVCVAVPIAICLLIKKNVIKVSPKYENLIIATCMISGLLLMVATCLSLRLLFPIVLGRERRCGSRVLKPALLHKGTDFINMYSKEEMNQLDNGEKIDEGCCGGPSKCECHQEKQSTSRTSAFLSSLGNIISAPKHLFDSVCLLGLSALQTTDSILYSFTPQSIETKKNPTFVDSANASQSFSAAKAKITHVILSPLGPFYALHNPDVQPHDSFYESAEMGKVPDGESTSSCCMK